MARLTRIVPISDFRHQATKILKHVRDSSEPMIITQRGRAAAVILSVETYERSEHDRELLLALVQGEKEIEADDGHDLDSVLAEADTILAKK
jgi:prevent-host-death family protein